MCVFAATSRVLALVCVLSSELCLASRWSRSLLPTRAGLERLRSSPFYSFPLLCRYFAFVSSTTFCLRRRFLSASSSCGVSLVRCWDINRALFASLRSGRQRTNALQSAARHAMLQTACMPHYALAYQCMRASTRTHLIRCGSRQLLCIRFRLQSCRMGIALYRRRHLHPFQATAHQQHFRERARYCSCKDAPCLRFHFLPHAAFAKSAVPRRAHELSLQWSTLASVLGGMYQTQTSASRARIAPASLSLHVMSLNSRVAKRTHLRSSVNCDLMNKPFCII